MSLWSPFFLSPVDADSFCKFYTASQITSLTMTNSAVYSCTDQRKHQSSASLAFLRGIHRLQCIDIEAPHMMLYLLCGIFGSECTIYLLRSDMCMNVLPSIYLVQFWFLLSYWWPLKISGIFKDMLQQRFIASSNRIKVYPSPSLSCKLKV